MFLDNPSDGGKGSLCPPIASGYFRCILIQMPKRCISTILFHCKNNCFMLFHSICSTNLLKSLLEIRKDRTSSKSKDQSKKEDVSIFRHIIFLIVQLFLV